MCDYKLPGGVETLRIASFVEHKDPTPAIPHSNPLLLGQYNTEAILRKHIERLGGVVEYGTELRSFTQHADSVEAVVATKAGDAEKLETVFCHWLVGSDGTKGVVRKQLGLSFVGETSEEGQLLIGLVEVQGLGTEYFHAWGEISAGGVVLMPTEKPGYFSMLISGNDIDLRRMADDRDAIRQLLRKRVDRQDLVFGAFEAVSYWRPNIRMVDKFGEGRVFVAGDAAHAHSPAGGQGLNSSVQDAFNIAWKLALVEKHAASPSLLATYNEERLPVIAAMLQKSTLLFNAMQKGKEDGWKRGGDLFQLGVNYRWSSIVVDERTPKPKGPEEVNPYGDGSDGSLRAGDRAPDAPGLLPVSGGAPTSLFDVFGPNHHTVLLFNVPAEESERVLAVTRNYPDGLVKAVVISPQGASAAKVAGQPDVAAVDQDGHAFAGYQVPLEEPTIVIVRPDGVVGGTVYSLSGFQEYFRNVFSLVEAGL
ncbi:hypothetical protein FOMPIDRAFT_142547 [Fomitopsis schrenkii]|uniref:FAD-binding domain-containing protein n=1 Tax=Fomitopsis schrenkii TaxID=2126942 RepID=S8FBC7_FOMSC|nr:hypothetical protein FOMPIDRAFT_142547 [Fomitopsis schrenkii]